MTSALRSLAMLAPVRPASRTPPALGAQPQVLLGIGNEPCVLGRHAARGPKAGARQVQFRQDLLFDHCNELHVGQAPDPKS